MPFCSYPASSINGVIMLATMIASLNGMESKVNIAHVQDYLRKCEVTATP